MVYAKAANSITAVNPASTASSVASAALITDMQLLIPHAQGIFFSSMPDNNFKPSGNGIPINKEGTAIIIAEMHSFKPIEIPVLV
jgi:hypothetical protein